MKKQYFFIVFMGLISLGLSGMGRLGSAAAVREVQTLIQALEQHNKGVSLDAQVEQALERVERIAPVEANLREDAMQAVKQAKQVITQKRVEERESQKSAEKIVTVQELAQQYINTWKAKSPNIRRLLSDHVVFDDEGKATGGYLVEVANTGKYSIDDEKKTASLKEVVMRDIIMNLFITKSDFGTDDDPYLWKDLDSTERDSLYAGAIVRSENLEVMKNLPATTITFDQAVKDAITDEVEKAVIYHRYISSLQKAKKYDPKQEDQYHLDVETTFTRIKAQ